MCIKRFILNAKGKVETEMWESMATVILLYFLESLMSLCYGEDILKHLGTQGSRVNNYCLWKLLLQVCRQKEDRLNLVKYWYLENTMRLY